MKLLKYIILGIIQGFTEPLPISSSGHMVIFEHLLNNFSSDLNFEIFANFGSFLAIFIIFFKDIKELITSFFTYIFTKDELEKKKHLKNFKYCLLIIVGSIPVGIMGIIVSALNLDEKLKTPTFVGIALLVTALLLFIVRKQNGNKKDEDITFKNAIVIGLMQVIALMPGISRSGIVLVGCLLCKLNKESSLKYTFMLYFPVSCATMLLGVKDIIELGNLNEVLIPYTLGLLMSCIVTYFSYKWLSEIVKKGNLWYFSIYCILIGIFTIIWFR